MKEQGTRGLLNSPGIKTPLSKIPMLNICFECNSIESIKWMKF